MGSPRKADQEEAKNRPKDHFTEGGMPSVKVKGRSCTDVLCLVLFALNLVFMLGVTGYAVAAGDLTKYTTKYDMHGAKCEGATPNKLFTRLMPVRKYKNSQGFPVPVTGGPNVAYYSVCVDKCPSKGDDVNFKPNKDYQKGTYELKGWDHDTESVIGFCFPSKDIMAGIGSFIFKELNDSIGGFGKYMKDLQESWQLIILMSVLALVITIVYMFLLQWITKPILYVSLALILIFGLLITVFLFFESNKYPEGSEDYNYVLAACIVSGVLTLIYIIFLCCQCKNIAIAADIMAASGEFVSKNTRVTLVPLVCYICCFPVIFWYAAVNVFMYSIGEPKHVDGKMFAVMENATDMSALFWVFMFAFFWVIAFIISLLQFIIAATVALWYFKHSNSDAPSASICQAVGWAFRYHLGSLAFGAFLIAVTTMIKVLFEYFAKKYEKLTGDNCCVKAVLCCIRYYIWCLDACVKFISANAYIQVAINGSTFCEGAKKSFFMIVGNPGTFTAMNLVGWIMTSIGKGVVIGLSVYLTILLAQQGVLITTEGGRIEQPFVPAFIVLLIAYLVSALFISIFDFACLTILQCFITSKECGGDSNGKVFAPKSLRGYLKKSGEEEFLEDEYKAPTSGTIVPHSGANTMA